VEEQSATYATRADPQKALARTHLAHDGGAHALRHCVQLVGDDGEGIHRDSVRRSLRGEPTACLWPPQSLRGALRPAGTQLALCVRGGGAVQAGRQVLTRKGGQPVASSRSPQALHIR